ncbi:hypothetical protein PMAYCL1PPCAC_07392 [Pristionchus mayeri]|uniref:Ammonium transporter AmtB-like domain-containing protein n=1 Tax=Pristionchus mayeri TaxID=1317129 RepID=A0AAN4ZG00_9BILA|nr:hypothetical protein PMAYCL1PPCAC_07392 [Pristionchus mayeri]
MIGESAFNTLSMADPFAGSIGGLIPGSNSRLDQLNMTQQQMQDDGVWVITSSFTIFTMTSGFGLLESGRVSSKDEVNIMVKNVIDVIFGGLSYWMFGFGMTFGDSYPNPFIGIGKFFFDPDEKFGYVQGWNYANFIFQMSFATTTSTIVSAGMAERIRLKAYIVISFMLSVVHSIPAHWVWSDQGFFYRLGVIDSAGCSVVHLVGGISGLVATLYLKPRQNRFGDKGQQQLSNPTNAVLGTFMLWWGWLAFNTGSTYGVSKFKWRLAARSAVATLLSSAGGGMTIVLFSFLPQFTDRKIKVPSRSHLSSPIIVLEMQYNVAGRHAHRWSSGLSCINNWSVLFPNLPLIFVG